MSRRDVEVVIQGRNQTQQAFREVQAGAQRLGNTLTTRFLSASAAATALQSATRALEAGIRKMAEEGKSFSEVAGEMTDQFLRGVPVIGQAALAMRDLADIWTGAAERLRNMKATIGDANQALATHRAITESIHRRADRIAGVGTMGQIDRSVEAMREERRAIEQEIMEQSGQGRQSIFDIITETPSEHVAALDELVARYKDLGDELLEVRAVREQLAEVREGEAEAQRARQIEQEQQQLRRSLESITTTVEDQIATFGKSTDAIMRWRVEQIAASGAVGDAAVEHAQRQIDRLNQLNELERERLDNLRETERAVRDGQRVFEQTRTPLERYNAEIERLNDLLRQGAIDQDTFRRATEQAGEALERQQGLAGDGDQAIARVRQQLHFEEARLLTRAPGRMRDPAQEQLKVAEEHKGLTDKVARSTNETVRILSRILQRGIILKPSNLA